MKINYLPKQKHFARQWYFWLNRKKLDFHVAFVFNLLFWLTNMKIYSWKKYSHSLFRELWRVFHTAIKTQQVIIS